MRTRNKTPDPSRAARFPRGHCGRAGCRCTHTEGCDHGWVDMPPRQLHGGTYTEVAPCPVCRPDAMDRLMAGSTTVPELRLANPTPLVPDDVGSEALWGDGEWT